MFSRTTFLPSLAYNLLRNRWSSWNWFDRIDQTVILGALPFRGPVTDKLVNEENVRYVVSMNENFELRYFVTSRQDWKQKFGVEFLQLETPDILHSPSQSKLEIGVDFLLQLSQLQTDTFQLDQRLLLSSEEEEEEQSMNRNNDRRTLIFPWKIKNNGNYLLPDSLNQKTIWDSDMEDCTIIGDDYQPKSYDNLLVQSSESSSSKYPSVYVHCKAGRTRSATLVACYLIKRYNLTPSEAVQFIKDRRVQVFLHTKQWKAIESFFERHHRNCFKQQKQKSDSNNNCNNVPGTTRLDQQQQDNKQQSIIDV